MEFYRLTRPGYETDMEEARLNPVGNIGHYKQIPFVHCDVCGLTWGRNGYLRIPIVGELERLPVLQGVTLERAEWSNAVAELALALGVEFSALGPGMSVGLPQGEICGPVLGDIVHTPLGLAWVKRPVIDALCEIGATGVTYQRVELQWAEPLG